MVKDLSGSPKRAERDDKSLQSSTDNMEESRSDADTGPGSLSGHSIPASPVLEVGTSPQTGALVTLLSKISSAPIEVVRALEELRSMIDERVLGEIGAFRREIMARLDAMGATSKARMDARTARIDDRFDKLDAKLDSIHREIRIILAVATLLLALSGTLVYLGFVERTSVRGGSTATTTQQVQVPIPDVEEQTTPTSNPGLGTSTASGDVSGPNGDTPNADGSSLPTDP